uniref:DUF1640 domain-containing protein n=1 Tax=Candidatus Kentrum sp. SD TaxID=2126332 RepID=A0A450Y5L4_9GAMM|nr:MAG: hypothetical protein BECKSD772F_GA0070984_100611 [Candidatus Kentron sp. SD]VFK40623.1 MAG: hypothetical protein BECKSD772E_GA0070983_10082 [Candidatus Kentron sp. SD]VFK78027.1 MAG: hypothetical protein BECKSD772D_GA0070982_100530 [Candidatus Kentron sp. SD]
MPAVAFDTLKFTKRLIEAGMALNIAEATAEAFREASSEANLATRQDIELLKRDIRGLEERMEAGFAQMDAKFVGMESNTDAKFAQMASNTDAKFARMDAKFAQMESNTDAKFARMDTKLAQMESNTDVKFTQLDARFDHLETNLNARMVSMEQRMTIKLGGMMVGAAITIAALVKIL